MSHLRLKSRKSSSESPTNKGSKPVSAHGEYRRLQFTLLKGHLEHRFFEVMKSKKEIPKIYL
ncbi:hypothetical protein K0M31_019635 [Melipona bicolor]|uniref:Uncharacterized protein n=1 Tax=Melipona bicolor TaxID=60889 RepID=A0AA40G2Q2_9HYME|nr:hypothetical protein K0M31_019635 [Melipona bicolor]